MIPRQALVPNNESYLIYLFGSPVHYHFRAACWVRCFAVEACLRGCHSTCNRRHCSYVVSCPDRTVYPSGPPCLSSHFDWKVRCCHGDHGPVVLVDGGSKRHCDSWWSVWWQWWWPPRWRQCRSIWPEWGGQRSVRCSLGVQHSTGPTIIVVVVVACERTIKRLLITGVRCGRGRKEREENKLWSIKRTNERAWHTPKQACIIRINYWVGTRY